MVNEKPITNQRLKISETVDEILWHDLPINKWCREQERKNKKIKL